MELVQLPCEVSAPSVSQNVRFDPSTGLMTYPVKEQWMVWKVQKGGAYLFFPDRLAIYKDNPQQVELGGYVVTTPHWNERLYYTR
jgi:hypothetical protein